MADYTNLKATINAVIRANGNEEITGPVLNSVLNQMADTSQQDVLEADPVVADFPTTTFHMGGNGTWLRSSVYRSIFIPLLSAQTWTITANPDVASILAFVKAIPTAAGQAVSFATGESRRVITKGETSSGSVPSDAVYLWLSLYSSAATNPAVVIIDGYDIKTSLKEKIVAINASIEALEAIPAHRAASLANIFSKDWRLNAAMSVNDDGDIIGTGVPSNNTAISFNKAVRDVWWVRAIFKRREATYINAGIVLAESQNGKVFRIMKLGLRRVGGSGSSIVDLYSHPNGSFVELKRVLNSSDAAYLGDEFPALLAISGDVVSAYLSDTFLGHAKFARINGKSDTMFGGILMSADNGVGQIEFGRRPTPYAHFSLDDVGRIMYDIASNTSLTSIFENEMFAFLKAMHDTYGMCVTLNMFYSIVVDGVTWNLSSFPATFKQELIANSGWLKFAFHGGDETVKYNTADNNAAALSDYANFVAQVARFASEACIDYVPRLTFFSGNKALLAALRDTGNFMGCLTADDTRAENCGLSATEKACINVSSDYIDFANLLYYVRSSQRFDTQTTAEVTTMVTAEVNDNGRNRVFEYFTHAQNTLSQKDRASIEAALQILTAHGIRMDFAANNLPF